MLLSLGAVWRTGHVFSIWHILAERTLNAIRHCILCLSVRYATWVLRVNLCSYSNCAWKCVACLLGRSFTLFGNDSKIPGFAIRIDQLGRFSPLPRFLFAFDISEKYYICMYFKQLWSVRTFFEIHTWLFGRYSVWFGFD